MGFIYKIVNHINGKVYIGKTDSNVNQRFAQHLHDSQNINKRIRPLYRAILKYGVENFSIEILEECDRTVSDLREKYYIDLFNTYHYGYNATRGGDGRYRLDMSDEDIMSRYSLCLSAAQVAREFSCSKKSILSRLNRLGISTVKTKQTWQKVRNKTLSLDFNSVAAASEYLINNGLTSMDTESVRTCISRAAHKRRKKYLKCEWELI